MTKEIARECSHERPCDRCTTDLTFLRGSHASVVPLGKPVRAVDLFCGCGGMTLGLAEAARRAGRCVEVALAIDSDEQVLQIYRQNFGENSARCADIGSIFNGRPGSKLTESELAIAADAGEIDLLVGGPPCQGHSDLNNHTRRNDPKNALYLKMARAAAVLKARVVVVENVSAVQHDKERVALATTEALQMSGYVVASRVVDFRTVGVPQSRKRLLLVASKEKSVSPKAILESLDVWRNHSPRTVRWAIEDLCAGNSQTVFDCSSIPNKVNKARMSILFDRGLYDLPDEDRPACHRDNQHSYRSVYGRLRWDQPAPTITTGFGCMGQGRYVHPALRRTITPHEAARLQTFPDSFSFSAATRRGVLAKAIGNAVPPLLMMNVGMAILDGLS
jgi:DNA (cytosine-5)-methyltransferase 1